MKILLISVLLFFAKPFFAQDYFSYYQSINKAKNCIIKDSLKKALIIYYKTFKKYDFVFARDCYNALEIAAELQNQSKIMYFLKRSLTQGINLKQIKKDTALTKKINAANWKEINRLKDSLSTIYMHNVNWEIRKEVIALFTQDQKIRDLADKRRINFFKTRSLNKQLKILDHKLVMRILEITETYGFPGEKLIGLDTKSMHHKITTSNFSAAMPIIIFIHHYSNPNLFYTDLFIREIKKGNLLNKHFATLADFSYTYGKNKNKSSRCYSFLFKHKVQQSSIDINRQQIALLPVSKLIALKMKGLITTPYYLY